jgi:7-cyano-7-deazaguanine synthase
LVILSGGQDSTTCLFLAKERFEEVHAITFDYNQRHIRELLAAQDVAKLAGIQDRHTIVKVGPLLNGASPLTDHSQPLETYENYQQMDEVIGDRVELTFVPMRNAFFLTLAANYAISKGIRNVITGVCQADNANYPDCRHNFILIQQEAINYALGIEGGPVEDLFHIYTPLMHLSKAESIKLAKSTQFLAGYYALAYSHTSYDGKYPPIDTNHSNVLRAHGFEEAGVPDPLVVRAWHEGLMELPTTQNYQDETLVNNILDEIHRMREVLGVSIVDGRVVTGSEAAMHISV